MVRGKSKIPERWMEYKSLGQRIPETRFICCKCPLKEDLCRKLPSKSKWFTPQDLFRKLAEENNTLGLIIDLTNTDRYYNPDEFTYANAEYVKIYTPGHDVPGQETIEMFREVIKTFEKKYADKNHMIAVHCTHGVNRTGYIICHYLIETCGWSFDKAVQTFNLARGHPIERENYLSALKELEINVAASIDLKRSVSDKSKKHKRRRHSSNASSSSNSSSISNKSSNSSSSTSSADSLFKPEIQPVSISQQNNVAAAPSILPGQIPAVFAPPVSGVAPTSFDPALMQQVYARMQQAMLSRFGMNVPASSLRLPTAGMVPGIPGAVPFVMPTPGLVAPSTRSNAADVVQQQTLHQLGSSSGSSSSSSSSEESGSESESDKGGGRRSTSSSSSAASSSTAGAQSAEEGEPAEAESAAAEIAVPTGTAAAAIVDWEGGGRVDKKTAAQKRRERQKRVRRMHETLQSGQFWRIREMQKERYGF